MRENRKTDYRFKLLYAFAIIMVVLDHADGGGIALKTDWYLYGGLPLPLFIFCSGYFTGTRTRITPGCISAGRQRPC